MKPKIILPLGLLLSVLTLSACDVKLDDLKARLGFGQAVENPGLDELSACKLLTLEEANTITGLELFGPKSSSFRLGDTVVTSCTYTTSSTTATVTSSVRFILQQFATPEETQRNYEAAREQAGGLSGTQPEDVADLGEAAYWAGGSLNHLGVRKGNRWYQVQMKEVEDPKTKAIELLKAALPTNKTP
jgi:hypothetical protein